jgi:hypothetical protein
VFALLKTMRKLALVCFFCSLCLPQTAWPQAAAIDGDFDDNGLAGPSDLYQLLSSFGQPVAAGSGNLAWARRIYGNSFDGANAVAVRGDGSILLTGGFSTGAVFGEGQPGEMTIPSKPGFYLADYSAEGVFSELSYSSNSGSGNIALDNGIEIAIHPSNGRIHVTGDFQNTATFGLGGATQSMVSSAGSADIFLAHFASNLDLQDISRAGGGAYQQGGDIEVRPNGTTLQLGVFDTQATFGPVGSELILDASSSRNLFMVQNDPTGVPQWGKVIDTTIFDSAYEAEYLSDGSILLTGVYDAPLTLGPGEPNQTELTPVQPFFDDFFLARFQPDGSLVWAMGEGGMEDDRAFDLAVLSQEAGFIVGGVFQGSFIFGQGTAGERQVVSEGGRDVFLARYDLDGNLAWVREAGGIEDENLLGVAATPDGGAVVCGDFKQSCVFGEGEPNETTLISEADFDGYVARYASDGGLLWAKAIHGPGRVNVRDVAVGPLGEVVAVGVFNQTATFGEGETNEITLESGGSTVNITAVFIAKFEP